MRHIGSLPDEVSAVKFSDHLLAKGIPNEVELNRDGSWGIWVHSEEQLEDARSLLGFFRFNPNHPEYNESARLAELHRRERAQADEEFRNKVYDRKRIFGWRSRIAPLTGILIAICVVIYILTEVMNLQKISELLAFAIPDMVGNFPVPFAQIVDGQIWRAITPIFLHFPLFHDPPLNIISIHLIFNMMWFRDLGTVIEKKQGPLMLCALMILIAIPSNMAQAFIVRHFFGGMSGVIYGLLGYIWIKSKYDPASGYRIDRQTVNFMIAWLFLCMTGMVGSVANYAHGAGLAAGCAIGYVSAKLATWRK